MNDRIPGIIVSLPGASVEEVRDQLRRSGGADVAEVRFDRWAPSDLDRAGELFPSPLPLLATLRSRAEGGAGPNDPQERAEILGRLGRLPFRWIDVESDRDTPAERLLPAPEILGRIRSSHLPAGTPAEEWRRRLREPTPTGTVRKVVVPATVSTALHELIPEVPPPEEASVVAHTTGPSGPLLRALACRLGLPLVYAALPESTAHDAEGSFPVEPTQIPTDRLRPYLEAGGHGPLFAVVGHPVAHSRSPALHHRWMRDTGRTGLYVPLDIASEEELVDSLPALGAWGFLGLNVTHPLKSAALQAATDLRNAARACGVANCLTLRDEDVEADNTDLAAILRRLEELRGDQVWDGGPFAVVGGGGAARATLAAARTLGVGCRLYGRRPDRLGELAREFDASVPSPNDARTESLVVHATDVGRGGSGSLEAPLERLIGPSTHVIDWVYSPDVPTIRERTLGAGGTYEDGIRLLVYQAAASFGLWWGEEPEPDAIVRALREEGCAA